jgi:hypothetical protein
MFAALLVSGAAAVPAFAQMREVGHGELRQMVDAGAVLGLGEALTLVNSRVDGNLVDVRAFEDDTLYYRVVVKRPDGQLVAAVVDARAGRLVSGRSSAAQEVMAAAKSKPAVLGSGSLGRGKSSGASGNGKGNAGGNGNGNGGGNSGGNGGGNGGGNSGNNGKP